MTDEQLKEIIEDEEQSEVYRAAAEAMFMQNKIKRLEQENEQLKYKRCLAMAEWCDAEADVADADGDYDDMRWYQK